MAPKSYMQYRKDVDVENEIPVNGKIKDKIKYKIKDWDTSFKMWIPKNPFIWPKKKTFWTACLEEKMEKSRQNIWE